MKATANQNQRSMGQVSPAPEFFSGYTPAAAYVSSKGGRMSAMYLRNLVQAGKGPKVAARWGRFPLFNRQDLDEWFVQRMRAVG
jgi:hypothetical protein